MKNFTNATIKRIEIKAEAAGFDKLCYFNKPDKNHKNYWVSDERTGLTHILLQDLTINTVDTDTYIDEKFNEACWYNDFCATTKRKGKHGYVTATITGHKNIRQTKVITNTAGLGHRIEVDHLNGNTYDNRRINLSAGSRGANAKNRYPYKEVPAIVYPWDHE